MVVSLVAYFFWPTLYVCLSSVNWRVSIILFIVLFTNDLVLYR